MPRPLPTLPKAETRKAPLTRSGAAHTPRLPSSSKPFQSSARTSVYAGKTTAAGNTTGVANSPTGIMSVTCCRSCLEHIETLQQHFIATPSTDDVRNQKRHRVLAAVHNFLSAASVPAWCGKRPCKNEALHALAIMQISLENISGALESLTHVDLTCADPDLRHCVLTNLGVLLCVSGKQNEGQRFLEALRSSHQRATRSHHFDSANQQYMSIADHNIATAKRCKSVAFNSLPLPHRLGAFYLYTFDETAKPSLPEQEEETSPSPQPRERGQQEEEERVHVEKREEQRSTTIDEEEKELLRGVSESPEATAQPQNADIPVATSIDPFPISPDPIREEPLTQEPAVVPTAEEEHKSSFATTAPSDDKPPAVLSEEENYDDPAVNHVRPTARAPSVDQHDLPPASPQKLPVPKEAIEMSSHAPPAPVVGRLSSEGGLVQWTREGQGGSGEWRGVVDCHVLSKHLLAFQQDSSCCKEALSFEQLPDIPSSGQQTQSSFLLPGLGLRCEAQQKPSHESDVGGGPGGISAWSVKKLRGFLKENGVTDWTPFVEKSDLVSRVQSILSSTARPESTGNSRPSRAKHIILETSFPSPSDRDELPPHQTLGEFLAALQDSLTVNPKAKESAESLPQGKPRGKEAEIAMGVGSRWQQQPSLAAGNTCRRTLQPMNPSLFLGLAPLLRKLLWALIPRIEQGGGLPVGVHPDTLLVSYTATGLSLYGLPLRLSGREQRQNSGTGSASSVFFHALNATFDAADVCLRACADSLAEFPPTTSSEELDESCESGSEEDDDDGIFSTGSNEDSSLFFQQYRSRRMLLSAVHAHRQELKRLRALILYSGIPCALKWMYRSGEAVSQQPPSISYEISSLRVLLEALYASSSSVPIVGNSSEVSSVDRVGLLYEYLTSAKKGLETLNLTVSRKGLAHEVSYLFATLPPEDILKPFNVKFHAESAIDGGRGGLVNELFSSYAAAVCPLVHERPGALTPEHGKALGGIFFKCLVDGRTCYTPSFPRAYKHVVLTLVAEALEKDLPLKQLKTKLRTGLFSPPSTRKRSGMMHPWCDVLMQWEAANLFDKTMTQSLSEVCRCEEEETLEQMELWYRPTHSTQTTLPERVTQFNKHCFVQQQLQELVFGPSAPSLPTCNPAVPTSCQPNGILDVLCDIAQGFLSFCTANIPRHLRRVVIQPELVLALVFGLPLPGPPPPTTIGRGKANQAAAGVAELSGDDSKGTRGGGEEYASGDPTEEADYPPVSLVVSHLAFYGWGAEDAAPYFLCVWLHESTAQQRREFLKLCTASEILSALAVDAADSSESQPLPQKIAVYRSEGSFSARTCFWQLNLPPFKSLVDLKEAMETALLSVRLDPRMEETVVLPATPPS